jgi:hypothetical protein
LVSFFSIFGSFFFGAFLRHGNEGEGEDEAAQASLRASSAEEGMGMGILLMEAMQESKDAAGWELRCKAGEDLVGRAVDI